MWIREGIMGRRGEKEDRVVRWGESESGVCRNEVWWVGEGFEGRDIVEWMWWFWV